MVGEIATLNHEILDNTMERTAFIRKSFAVNLKKEMDEKKLVRENKKIMVLTLVPSHIFLKFSAVLGTVSPKRPISILPASSPPIVISKKT